ncbi:MAG: PQQ-like beta-propeller repeat protein [Deltaproteobacteria bacterium]|nr:PQQ-like beta-propeller repeat protein [Deltaproteobacteria bacterium]
MFFYLNAHRTEFHVYHEILLKLRGDVHLQRTALLYQDRDVSKALISFKKIKGASFYPLWAFRPTHFMSTYAMPVVDDTDKDGIPEVYIGSNTQKIYALDGRDGHTLWKWSLPHGQVSGHSMFLEDIDGDGRNEVIFGSQISLPIRVYVLKTKPLFSDEERILWYRNVSGDFIEGGLNFAMDHGEKYILAMTRDAPYSRGSFNVIKADGKFLYPPIQGVDVCVGRPAIGRLEANSGRLSVVYGSHKYYGAAEGYKITARDFLTGEKLWQTAPLGDTGFQQQQILDMDGDGKNEVSISVMTLDDQENYLRRENYLLESKQGQILRPLPGWTFGMIHNEDLTYFRHPDKRLFFYYGSKGNQKIKTLNTGMSFGVRFVEDNQFHLVSIFSKSGKLYCEFYHYKTGALEKTYSMPFRMNLDLPMANGFSAPQQDFQVNFKALADVDGDQYWDALVHVGDYIAAVHLPIRVHSRYSPFSRTPHRNINNDGELYDFDFEDAVKKAD